MPAFESDDEYFEGDRPTHSSTGHHSALSASESDDEYFEDEDLTPSSARQQRVSAFNPVLARFVPKNTLPLDSQDEPSSRTLYQQWLVTRGITEEEHRRQLKIDEGHRSVISVALSPQREASEDSTGEYIFLRGAEDDSDDGESNFEYDDSESGGSNSELQMPTDGTSRVSLSPGLFSSTHSFPPLTIHLILHYP